MAYTIKKVEKETKISAHTLRFWAKKGLFPFVQKDENSEIFFKKRYRMGKMDRMA